MALHLPPIAGIWTSKAAAGQLTFTIYWSFGPVSNLDPCKPLNTMAKIHFQHASTCSDEAHVSNQQDINKQRVSIIHTVIVYQNCKPEMNNLCSTGILIFPNSRSTLYKISIYHKIICIHTSLCKLF